MFARHPHGLCIERTQRCTRIFQSVCPRVACPWQSREFAGFYRAVLFDGVQLPFISRVRIPPCAKSVSPVAWFCPSGRKKNGTRNRVRERFYSDIRYHSAKREVLRHIWQSNANGALPENGYRVLPNSAKRFLSALCRKHSNFQPLLLHE